jgi:hypothetical protein
LQPPSSIPLCIAFVHSRDCDSVWVPCARTAKRGDRFCAAHRDSLDGAVMGCIHMNRPRYVRKTQTAASQAAGEKSSTESRSHWYEIIFHGVAACSSELGRRKNETFGRQKK